MPKWLQSIEGSLKTASSVVEKKLMRDFAHKFGLVYFGSISAQSDEYEVVRGVTLHTNHHDKHFIIGNYRDYDVTVVQRHVELSHPNHGTNHYKWTVLQADLHTRRLPHILITTQQHDQLFFDNLRIKLANFQQLAPELIPDHAFAKHFSVFTITDGLDEIPTILTPEIMAALVHYFKGFDVEMFDDQVIVYTSQPRVTLTLLQEILREALWLAMQLDDQVEQHQKTPEAETSGA